MQRKNEKTLFFRNTLAQTVKDLRISQGFTGNQFANEFDIDSGNLSRIENSIIDCKFITIWRIAEGLGMTFPEFAQILYNKLGKDFKLMDE